MDERARVFQRLVTSNLRGSKPSVPALRLDAEESSARKAGCHIWPPVSAHRAAGDLAPIVEDQSGICCRKREADESKQLADRGLNAALRSAPAELFGCHSL